MQGERLEEILAGVERPVRYIGGEWQQVVKDHRKVDLTLALAYPDVYEIGMSHLGFRILYSLLNARPDTAAERVFCPWPDMADALRLRRRPLATLETGTPLRRLDVVGFSLQYEMTFTNILEMLDLGGIPLRTRDRDEDAPLVIAGGPVVFNCEPLADFLDAVLVGDGEELLPEFLDALSRLKRAGAPRARRLRELSRIPGVYVPSLYGVQREPGRGLLIPVSTGGAPYPVRRRLLLDLDRFPFPDRIVVPHSEIVHDRVSVEIMRGCPVGCRFCQAGYIYRPTRERDPNQVRDTVIRSVRATGYDAFSLASLNSGRYGAMEPLLVDLMGRFEPECVSVSLSSLHASTLTPTLAQQVRRVRKSGFTIAPEAGTQRLRNVINKNLSEEQILTAARLAFEAGWAQIKLYFMIGLPTETDDDVDGLVDLTHRILAEGRGVSPRVSVTLSVSSFIPKAVTPFQWLGMDRLENLRRKQDRIAARVRRGIRFRHHDGRTSFLEAVFSRGDRALGNVLERAWRGGARFDGWGEHFRRDLWEEAFRAEGVDPQRYAYGDWDSEQRLPWDVLDPLVSRNWLAHELHRALAGGTLGVCGPDDCHGCAPFARDCVQGVVAETTGRPLISRREVLSTPAAPGPGMAAASAKAPRLPSSGPRADRLGLSTVRYRYRARYAKKGRMRFLGHLDLTRTIQQGLRRALVPLAYSEGFNPKPRMAFGPALPVGSASEGEYLDFDAVARLDCGDVLERMNRSLPEGVRILALMPLPSKAPGLGESVRGARYRVEVPGLRGLAERVDRFQSGAPRTVRRERKGKVRTFHLAREVLDLVLSGEGTFRLTLAIHSGGSVRPAEVLREILGEDAARARITREDLLVPRNHRWINPLLAASAGARDVQRALR